MSTATVTQLEIPGRFRIAPLTSEQIHVLKLSMVLATDHYEDLLKGSLEAEALLANDPRHVDGLATSRRNIDKARQHLETLKQVHPLVFGADFIPARRPPIRAPRKQP